MEENNRKIEEAQKKLVREWGVNAVSEGVGVT